MTGEKKDRRSLFEISNSAFVESLSSNNSYFDAKHIPKKVSFKWRKVLHFFLSSDRKLQGQKQD